MSVVLINNTEFELHSYYVMTDGVSMSLLNASIDSVESAVGSGADVEIGDEYKGYDLILSSIVKDYDDDTLRVNMHTKSLEQRVDQNTNDIEINTEAILELAEIIG